MNNVGVNGSKNVSAFGTTYTNITDYTFNYLSIDIPVLFTIKVNKFNFAIGPYLSIPLGDVTETLTNIKILNNPYNDQSYKYPNRSAINFGATLGIGYEQRLGMGMLVFGGRYMHDFLPIEVKDSDSNVIARLWRGALAIDVGYKIPLSF